MIVCELGQTTIQTVAFAADGQTLYAGTNDGRVLAVVPFAEAREIFNAKLSDERSDTSVNVVRAHPTRDLLAIAATTGWMMIENSEAGNIRLTLPPRSLPTTSIEFFDDATVAVGFGDRGRESAGGFELWHYGDRPKRREPHFAEPKGVRAVAVHAASRTVAWATGHQKITVWNPAGQDPHSIPLKHTSPAIAFHPDGTLLVVAQEWGAKILDIAKRHEVRSFAGHTGRVTSVAFRPDGRVLATGSWDATVRLWDVATGQAIASLTAPLGRVMTLAYSPDGLRMAAAGDAGNVVIWDVE